MNINLLQFIFNPKYCNGDFYLWVREDATINYATAGADENIDPSIESPKNATSQEEIAIG